MTPFWGQGLAVLDIEITEVIDATAYTQADGRPPDKKAGSPGSVVVQDGDGNPGRLQGCLCGIDI